MNFARHLLRRVVTPLAQQRVVIIPSLATPLRLAQTPIPKIITPRLSQQVRHESTKIASPGEAVEDEAPVEPKPSYDLTFTCRPCGHRSTHTISKQGYHYGSVLITCPGCHNRHVISDHLKVFGETSRSFEEILSQSGSGETIKKSNAAHRSYEEQLAAEATLRERGIWSKDGNHVEVLPDELAGGIVEEPWQNGLGEEEDGASREEVEKTR